MSVASPSDPSPAPHEVVVGVSIPVPDPHGAYLQAKRAAFNDPQAMAIPAHVTLLGPTRIHRVQLPAFAAHLGRVAAAAHPFAMLLRGTGTFRPVSPVVFVQVAHGISGCEGLQRALGNSDYGASSTFPYHPHVTVAHDVPDTDLDRAFADLASWEAQFDVEQFWLYEQDHASRWIPVRAFPLGSAG
jgi:2'-5' RNA ligase